MSAGDEVLVQGGHALALADGQGLLLDLRSGVFLTLNETAAFVWSESLRGSDEHAIARVLAERFGLKLEHALSDVRAAMDLRGLEPPAFPTNALQYEREGEDYLLRSSGRPALRIHGQGRWVSLASEAMPHDEELRWHLHGVAPKVLDLQGRFVLHASAVRHAGGLTVFCGQSGAGKSTTAAAAARHGGELVATDKLVLEVDQRGVPHACSVGERLVETWASRTLATLAAGAERAPADIITAPGAGEPLRRVLWVDRSRREGQQITVTQLNAADAMALYFESLFIGSSDEQTWARHLEMVRRLAVHVPAFRATVPSGLVQLEQALGRYMTKLAS